MKIKKIKNIILTFVICLFGALAFNSVKAKALEIAPGIYANTGVTYYNSTGNRYLVLNTPTNFTLTGSSSDIRNSFILTNFYITSTQAYATTTSCYITDVSTSIYEFECDILSNRVVYGLFSGSSIPFSETYVENITYNGYITPNNSVEPNSLGSISLRASNQSLPVIYYASGEAYNEGYQTGLDYGYSTGYIDGYDEGYQTGIDSNGNTLVGMVGAIFTGPVTMLQTIFNFDVLGINFAEMLLGLTTLLVVIWLVKRFI